jgi:hypothetical protein
VHLTTEKSSGDGCTQRAEISVREESTYAPNIRKMISPKSETTRTDQAKSEKAKSKSKHEASRSTKQVETPSRSMTKRVKKQGQSEWENETRASAKMRQSKWKNDTKHVDQDQPKDKRSRRPPKSRDEGCRKTRRSTKITKSLPKFICLPNHDGNQQPI